MQGRSRRSDARQLDPGGVEVEGVVCVGDGSLEQLVVEHGFGAGPVVRVMTQQALEQALEGSAEGGQELDLAVPQVGVRLPVCNHILAGWK